LRIVIMVVGLILLLWVFHRDEGIYVFQIQSKIIAQEWPNCDSRAACGSL